MYLYKVLPWKQGSDVTIGYVICRSKDTTEKINRFTWYMDGI